MGNRFAAGLAITAALLATSAVKAQGWFGNYELSPRQIVGVLEDDGYEVSSSVLRRGDVYVMDAVSVSGRTVRLIVSARDGRVLDRYPVEERRRWANDDHDWRGGDAERPRPPRNVAGDDQDGAWSQPQRDQLALGDQFSQPSRVYGGDFSGPKAAPAPAPDGTDASKPKHHAQKKHHDASPAVAKAPATDAKPTPDAVASPEPTSPAPSPSVAAVQPSAPEKAAVEPTKPMATPEAVAPTPQPSQSAAEPEKHATVEAEKAPAPVAPAPKPETPKKKLNDLPVGTLD